MSYRQPLTPKDFKHVFEDTPGGPQILEFLVQRFATSATFVKGGHEADRETCYRLGQRSVIDYVLAMINRANGVQSEIEPNE